VRKLTVRLVENFCHLGENIKRMRKEPFLFLVFLATMLALCMIAADKLFFVDSSLFLTDYIKISPEAVFMGAITGALCICSMVMLWGIVMIWRASIQKKETSESQKPSGFFPGNESW